MSRWRAVARSTLAWLGGIGLTISGSMAGYVPSMMTREQIAAQNPYSEASLWMACSLIALLLSATWLAPPADEPRHPLVRLGFGWLVLHSGGFVFGVGAALFGIVILMMAYPILKRPAA